jgi:replication factor A1
MLDYEKILEEIMKRANVSREEIEKMISSKQEELSGLISKEGAAYLVARELGIDLEPVARKRLEIKNIVAGMKNINLIGRVFRISNITNFKRADGNEGKVVSIFIADKTGFIRLPLWNDQVKIVEEGLLKVGTPIQITNGIAKENIFGDVEISLGKYGSIKEIEAEDLPSLEEISNLDFFKAKRVLIKDIKPGIFEVRGTIVHVFKNKLFFYVCPVCNSTLEEKKCKEHGEVEAIPELVISCIVDDGTSNIRAVFFRETAEKLLGLKAEELQSLEQNFNLVEKKILGRELIISGRVKKNKIFDRLEILVNDFKDLNPEEESKKLLEELNYHSNG